MTRPRGLLRPLAGLCLGSILFLSLLIPGCDSPGAPAPLPRRERRPPGHEMLGHWRADFGGDWELHLQPHGLYEGRWNGWSYVGAWSVDHHAGKLTVIERRIDEAGAPGEAGTYVLPLARLERR